MRFSLKQYSTLPGFGLTLGYTLSYLGLIVLVPLAMLFLRTANMEWSQFTALMTNPRTIAAFKLSLGASLVAATINSVFGFIVAWVLVRYTFPGRRFMDAIVDLPFALPTSVSGIALTALYAPKGWFGAPLTFFGIHVAFTQLGVLVALIFIGLPFVVRTIQPVLEDLERETEEVATLLGATRWQTFYRVIVPMLLPALMTGFALAFARALGEYGSVVFIAGNMQGKTEIVPLLIMSKLEQYDYAGATAIAAMMLMLSFVLLLVINLLQRWNRKSI
ncbi:TPA: sulfate ABC transporter permease subunit CysT [Candidatus Sumerlaeota bacterium]|jgi:sulfate/thiosulfate transport system permease protein|nr:sulfate ABC transporter permease subunit CysT [Candidatus Sumerlaeota bacterium]